LQEKKALKRRASKILATLLCLLICLGMSTVVAAGDSPAPPSAPTNLSMTLVGSTKPLRHRHWVSARRVVFRFNAEVTTGVLTPEVEIEPFNVPFTDESNLAGTPLNSSGEARVRADRLTNGTKYHWQARIVDSSGLSSPWVPYAVPGGRKFDFGIDRDPPSRPVISSPTNPDQSRWYNVRVVSLRWTAHDAISGLKGYSFVLEHQAHVIPPGSITKSSQLQLTNLSDGVWFLALRAADRAGNWSPTATYRLQLDRQIPRVTWLSPARFTFNPYQGPTSVRFVVDKDVNIQLALYRVGDLKPTQTYSFSRLPAGRVTSLTWSGKDAKGRPVARGYYFFSVRAVDHADNVGYLNLGGIMVTPDQGVRTPTGQEVYPGDGKQIFVSLSRQTLYAYDGTRLVQQTFVTTGNPNLPTPAGSYTIIAKYSPWEFISPWPPGSPYWYPPSWSQYAMLFRAGGYFLHDAPWRSVFGPGSNGPGQPGSNYGGTHGCVNIPPGPMVFLWNWSPVGTKVFVVP
jgi:hypothetical protein